MIYCFVCWRNVVEYEHGLCNAELNTVTEFREILYPILITIESSALVDADPDESGE